MSGQCSAPAAVGVWFTRWQSRQSPKKSACPIRWCEKRLKMEEERRRGLRVQRMRQQRKLWLLPFIVRRYYVNSLNQAHANVAVTYNINVFTIVGASLRRLLVVMKFNLVWWLRAFFLPLLMRVREAELAQWHTRNQFQKRSAGWTRKPFLLLRPMAKTNPIFASTLC